MSEGPFDNVSVLVLISAIVVLSGAVYAVEAKAVLAASYATVSVIAEPTAAGEAGRLSVLALTAARVASFASTVDASICSSVGPLTSVSVLFFMPVAVVCSVSIFVSFALT